MRDVLAGRRSIAEARDILYPPNTNPRGWGTVAYGIAQDLDFGDPTLIRCDCGNANLTKISYLPNDEIDQYPEYWEGKHYTGNYCCDKCHSVFG
jgi:hypothetical protein